VAPIGRRHPLRQRGVRSQSFFHFSRFFPETGSRSRRWCRTRHPPCRSSALPHTLTHAVATERITHVRQEVLAELAKRFGKMDPLQSEDIADAVAYVVTRPRRVAVNEMLVRPTNQEG